MHTCTHPYNIMCSERNSVKLLFGAVVGTLYIYIKCIIDRAAREDLSEIAKHTHGLPVCHKKPFLFRMCLLVSLFYFIFLFFQFYLFNTLLAAQRRFFFNGHPMTRRISPFIPSSISYSRIPTVRCISFLRCT